MPDPGKSMDWTRVETWLFDLDHTLYSPHAGILDQVSVLMTDFIQTRLGVHRDRAHELRQLYWAQHGATMTGLIREHDVDPDEFLIACHQLDLSALVPDPDLAHAIDALPGRRLIHTNGPRHHAERLLDQLGLEGHFERIISVEDTGYVPKPAPAAHQIAVELATCDPASTAMIDDMVHNLHHPAEMGMTTVWLCHDRDREAPDHVHHRTSNLVEFLTEIV